MSEMLIGSKQTLFVGAKATYQKKEVYVYKLNDKTSYVGERSYEQIAKFWSQKVKEDTWLKFMKRNNGVKADNSEILIDPDESAKKEEIEAIAKRAVKNKKILPALIEKKMQERYRMFMKGNPKAGNNMTGDKMDLILYLINPNGQVLFRKDNKRYFYDLENQIYTLFKIEEHKPEYGNHNVIWPRGGKLDPADIPPMKIKVSKRRKR